MIAITGIDHIVLRARDQEALVRFYIEVLGPSSDGRTLSAWSSCGRGRA